MSTSEPTPASEWRARRGIVVSLPSGNSIRMIRTLDLLVLLRNNLIPNPLSEVLTEMITKKKVVPDLSKLDAETLKQLAAFINDNVIKCVTYPKVHPIPEGADPNTWQPEDENGISIVDLSWEDRNFIFSVAQGGATDLTSFRAQQKKAMATLEDVPGVESPPQQPNRATRRAVAKKS